MKATKLLNQLKERRPNDRTKTSLYLSKALFRKFKKACKEVAPSLVMEELMKEFLSSHKK